MILPGIYEDTCDTKLKTKTQPYCWDSLYTFKGLWISHITDIISELKNK
jgi:hypothetical protein